MRSVFRAAALREELRGADWNSVLATTAEVVAAEEERSAIEDRLREARPENSLT